MAKLNALGRAGGPGKLPATAASIDPHHVPRHVAIIMDGNGRWARRRGLPRTAGHRAGVEALRRVVRACGELGIPYLTVYAFSTENWRRPPAEVSALMELLVHALRDYMEELHSHGVRVRVIGHVEALSPAARQAVDEAVERTASNNHMTLIFALNYGGRREIIDAVRELAEKARAGELDPAQIDEQLFARHLYTADIPDPDLLIRPSGEMRVSNFLLWQLAYTEFWVTPVLWPDFDLPQLLEAIHAYQSRDRRYGGLKGGPARGGAGDARC